MDSPHLVRRVVAQDVTANTGSRRPVSPYLCDVTSADGMASLLSTVLAVSERPAALLLEELAHTEIRIELLSRSDRALTASERYMLDSGPMTSAHHSVELVLTRGGIVAAETQLVILPQQLPAGARAILVGTRIPVGAILAQFGARRLDRRALCRGGCQDSAGKDVAVESFAMLAIGDGCSSFRVRGWVMPRACTGPVLCLGRAAGARGRGGRARIPRSRRC